MHGDGAALGSRYTLLDMIGQGGMGVVWRARDRASGADRAVKVLRPELAADPAAVTRFVRERTALLKVRHAGVVTVHDLVVEGDRLALVMDLVLGEDLAGYRKRRGGALLPAEAAWLVGQVCAALVAVHEAGLVHRDLKPANVLLDHTTPESPVRLADFGVARIAVGDELTATGNVVGTPRYMAPEVLEGAEPGPAADVYAVGVTLYELLAGRQPFAGNSISAVMHEHLHVAPPPLPDLPAELWTLIEQSLAKQPMARIGAYDLGRRLLAYAESTYTGRFAITVPPNSPARNPTSPPGTLGAPNMSGAHGMPGPSGTQGVSPTSGAHGVSGAHSAFGPSGTGGAFDPGVPDSANGPSATGGAHGASGPGGTGSAAGPNGAGGASGLSGAHGASGPGGAFGTGGGGLGAAHGEFGPRGAGGPSSVGGARGAFGTGGAGGLGGAHGAFGPNGAGGLSSAGGVDGAHGAFGVGGGAAGAAAVSQPSMPTAVNPQQGPGGVGGRSGVGDTLGGTLAVGKRGSGRRRGVLIGAGAAVVAAAVGVGVTLALTGGGGGTKDDQVKAAGEASSGKLAVGVKSGAATPSGKGKSPGASPSASGSGSASPGKSPGASPSQSAPGADAPKATDWACGPRSAADARGHYLTACIRTDGHSVLLRATMDPVASRDDPKLIASNHVQVVLVLKTLDQTNAGRWVSPVCTSLTCTFQMSATPPRGSYRTLAGWMYQGIYEGTGKESPPVTF
ncbi:serine/threonine-protein kinase [Actinomadura rupiterrae]|uniref:serine/threonine-protein kinase n=1 Tax=Actinomadura rupiterrae TaxID=559627 RepID=UPI0020A442ED|nr:serine/threonine-protein kinase [Actinomadura rupiterrae]MCP2341656.1 serine/threonine protein kinase [Actinomadura rupiterrae]